MSDIQQAVREKYGAIATAVTRRRRSAAAAAHRLRLRRSHHLQPLLRRGDARVPADAVAASLGLRQPDRAARRSNRARRCSTSGSGGGIDVLLSARRVGSDGKVYGVDMTDEMLALARENQRKAGATNVEFLKGTIEAIPLPDARSTSSSPTA